MLLFWWVVFFGGSPLHEHERVLFRALWNVWRTFHAISCCVRAERTTIRKHVCRNFRPCLAQKHRLQKRNPRTLHSVLPKAGPTILSDMKASRKEFHENYFSFFLRDFDKSFCALEMSRKYRRSQGITREIRNFPKIIISE